MAHLIDKDRIVAEIERRLSELAECSVGQRYAYQTLLEYIDTLEVKGVDLEEEIQRQYNVHKNPNNSIVKDCVIMTKDGFEYFAKHFFELGVKAQKL